MLNDALMIGIVLTLVFGAVIFYLYNRLSLAERKMGLVEGMLTDLKIMFDSAPLVSEPVPYHSMEQNLREFEPTPELIQAISGPRPAETNETEDIQESLEKALEGALQSEPAYRTLQIDEAQVAGTQVSSQPIQVTKLSPDLDSMTVNELKAVAKEKGVTIPANTRRREIIDLIRKAAGGIQGTVLADLEGPDPPAGGATIEELGSIVE